MWAELRTGALKIIIVHLARSKRPRRCLLEHPPLFAAATHLRYRVLQQRQRWQALLQLFSACGFPLLSACVAEHATLLSQSPQ